MQGALYLSLQFLVVLYIVVLVILSKGYLSTKPPSITFSVWSAPGTSNNSEGLQSVTRLNTSDVQPYCGCGQHPQPEACGAYQFSIPSFGVFANFTCATLPHSASVKTDTQNVFVATAIKVIPLRYTAIWLATCSYWYPRQSIHLTADRAISSMHDLCSWPWRALAAPCTKQSLVGCRSGLSSTSLCVYR
jgi:hypothetical protein